MHKLDALTRILEVESFDGMLVFVRTKQSTVELAEKLAARGFAAAALNGDLQQAQRERTVAQLKEGKIDILVATDVAARGLDVERISHVINFDVPYDTESYVHRIGRTGRAGRSGEAILFIAPRERNMLHAIERATRQPIETMTLPSVDDVNAKRVAKFKARIATALTSEGASAYRAVVEEFAHESGVEIAAVAAALAQLAQGKTPLLLSGKHVSPEPERHGDAEDDGKGRGPRRARGTRFDPQDMYRLEVGSVHGVQPGNIVGAIANEARLDGSQINGIDIRGNHSFVRLPEGMPAAVLTRLQGVRVKGQLLAIARVERRPPPHKAARRAERARKDR